MSRWCIALAILAILASALLADAQTTTYHPAAAAAPQNFQIIRSVGQATDDATNNFGGQSQIWLNWQAPQNYGNDGAPGEYGAYLGAATSTWTCTTVTGAVCSSGTAVTYPAYGQFSGTANGMTATYDLILKEYTDALGGGQSIQPNASYNIQLFSVNSYGVGAMTSALSVRVGYKGTPQAPAWATGATYISPSSFVVTWTPSKDIGQADFAATQSLIIQGYDVQVRRVSETLANQALYWYTPDNSLSAFSFTAATGFHTESMLIQTLFLTSANATPATGAPTYQLVVPGASYQVRVRANNTWGKGLWSTFFAIQTPASTTGLIANRLTGTPTVSSTSSTGGLISWSMNGAQTTALANSNINNNIIGVAGSTVQSFWMEWSCVNISVAGNPLVNVDTNCPTATSGGINGASWNGSSYSNLLYTNGRVSGGSGVITSYPNSATATAIYVRVNVSVSGTASQTSSTSADSGNWRSFTPSTNNVTLSWGAGSAVFQTCWGVSNTAQTSCQVVLTQPATVGTLTTTVPAPVYSVVQTSTTNGLGAITTTLPTSGATTYGWVNYTFIVSVATVSATAGNNAIDVAALNGKTGATAVTSSGNVNGSATLQNECNANGLGVCQGQTIVAPAIIARDGTADGAGKSFLAIGKGTSGANGWVAVRFTRSVNTTATNATLANFSSGFHSTTANTGSAVGNLTWSVYQTNGAAAGGVAAWSIGTGNSNLIALPVGCSVTNGMSGGTGAAVSGSTLTAATPGVASAIIVSGTGITNTAPTCTVTNPGNAGAPTFGTLSYTYGVASVTPTGASVANGYNTNDLIALKSGDASIAGLACTTMPIFVVTGANAVSVSHPGVCQTLPAAAITAGVTVASSAGAGATLNITFGVTAIAVGGTAPANLVNTFGLKVVCNNSILAYATYVSATSYTVAVATGTAGVGGATATTLPVTAAQGSAPGTPATTTLAFGVTGVAAVGTAGVTCTANTVLKTPAGAGAAILGSTDFSTTAANWFVLSPGTFGGYPAAAALTGQTTVDGGAPYTAAGCGTYPKLDVTIGVTSVTIANAANTGYTNVAYAGAVANANTMTGVNVGFVMTGTTLATATATAGTNYLTTAPTASCTTLLNGSTGTLALTGNLTAAAPLTVSYVLNGGAASMTALQQIAVVAFQTYTGTTYTQISVGASTSATVTAASSKFSASSTDTYAQPGVAALTAPSGFGVVDITDTTAVFVFTAPAANAAVKFATSDYPGTGTGSTAAFTHSVYVDYPSTNAVAGQAKGTPAALFSAVNTCTLMAAASKNTAGQANDENTIYGSTFTVQCTGFIPGRQFTANGSYLVTAAGTAQARNAFATNAVFTTGSLQIAAPNRNPNVGGASSTLPVSNSYYYATTTSFQLFYQPVGSQIGDNVSYAGLSSIAPGNYAAANWYATLQNTNFGGSSVPNAQRPQVASAGITNLSLGAVGNWSRLTINNTGAADGTTSSNFLVAQSTYTVNVWFNAFTTPSAADSITVTTSTSATKVAATAPKVGTAVRRITDTSAWIEIEAPSDVGVTAGSPWAVTNCSGGATTATVASIAGVAGGTTNNFNLLAITGLTGSSGACGSMSLSYANGQSTGTVATVSVSSFTLAASTSTAPGTPATPTFDQVSTQSFLVYVEFPQVAGGSVTTTAGAGNGFNVGALGATSDVQLITGGTTYNILTANADANNTGTPTLVSTTFNGTGVSYATGYTVRLISYTNTAATPVTTRIAQATAYTVQARVTNSNASTASSYSSAGALPLTGGLTSNNGDQPDAPTNLAASRITSTSVRLTFNRPINMGGAPQSISNFATGTIAPLLSGTNQLFRVWYSYNGGANTALTSLTIAAPTTMTSGNANPGVQPNYKNSVTGTSLTYGWLQGWYVDVAVPSAVAAGSYSFNVAVNNQFSYATASNTGVLVTADKINTATLSVTLAAANTNPTAPTLTVTYFSNFYVYLAWSDATNFGTNSVTNYQVQKSSGGGAAANVGSAVALNAGYAQPYSVVDTTGVTPGTQYSYTLVVTAGALTATSAGVNVTPDTANTATTTPNTPGAPAAPIVAWYSDSTTSIRWLGPQDQGGVQTSSTTAFYAYQIVQTFQAASGEPTSSNCPVYIISATTGNFGSYGATTIPGKAYSYTVAAMIQYTPNGKTAVVTPVGSPSSAATQAANSIKKAYPYPVITWSATSKNGGGYLTLGQSVASASSNLGVTTSTTVNGGMDGKGGPGYSYAGVTSQNGLGVLVEQMSPQNSTTVATGTFNPDTFYWYSSFGATTSSYVISGLVAKSTYRFKLNSVNGFANAEQTAADVTATTGTAVAPGAVSTITSNILAKRPTSIMLSWAPPTETGGVGTGLLATYKSTLTVVGQTAVAFTNSTVTAIPWSPYQALSGVFTGLTSGASYTVNVWGSNGKETASPPAGSFVASQPAGNGLNNQVTTGQVPDLPVSLAVSSNTATQVVLSWSFSGNVGSSAITSYLITGRYVGSTGGSGTNTAFTSIAVANVVAPLTGTVSGSAFVNGSLYRVQVGAVNAVSSTQSGTTTGEYSAALIFQATINSPTPNTVPTAMGKPVLQFYSPNEYRVSWTDSSSLSSNPSNYYLLTFWTVGPRVVASTNVAGFTLQKHNGSLQLQQVGGAQYVPINGYQTGGMIATCAQIVYAILPSTSYYVAVAGVDANNNVGTYSPLPGSTNAFVPVQTQTATAAAPTTLSATGTGAAITNTSYTITFNAPTYTGLANIFGYQITTSPEYGGRQIIGYLPVTNSNTARATTQYSFTQTGLQPGTNYIVNARSLNSYGASIPSQNLRVTTTGGSAFSAQTSFWTLVLLALASILAFAF